MPLVAVRAPARTTANRQSAPRSDADTSCIRFKAEMEEAGLADYLPADPIDSDMLISALADRYTVEDLKDDPSLIEETIREVVASPRRKTWIVTTPYPSPAVHRPQAHRIPRAWMNARTGREREGHGRPRSANAPPSDESDPEPSDVASRRAAAWRAVAGWIVADLAGSVTR